MGDQQIVSDNVNETTSPTSEPAVKMYTTVFCTYCHNAKRLLDEKGIDYESIDLTNKPSFRDFLKDLTGQMTVPQILIHGTPIGGYTELLRLEQSGRLDEMLAE